MNSSRPSEGKTLLFIPFSYHENNLPLMSAALDWQKKASEAGKEVPEIVLYSGKNETGNEYGSCVSTKFSEKNVTPDTTIYMLAHGLNDTRWVGNTQDMSYKLPIELAAKRAKEMGLTPHFVNNLRKFKLFICEESTVSNRKTTLSLAIHFAHELGPEYDNLLLAYYSAKVFTPCRTNTDNEIKRRAILASHYNEYTCILNQSPPGGFSTEEQAILDVSLNKNFVKASIHQHLLLIRAARNEAVIPMDEDTQWCMKTNRAANNLEQIYCAFFQLLICQETAQKNTASEKRNHQLG